MARWSSRFENAPKPKDFKGSIRKIWDMTRGQRNGLFPMLILSALISLNAVVSPWLIGKIVDEIEVQKTAIFFIGWLIAMYLFDCVVKWVQGFGMAKISQRMIRYIRKQLFNKLNRLPLSFYDLRQHGELMSRLTNDVDNISSTITDSIALLMQLGFCVIGVLIMMLVLNIWLTLAVLIVTPLIYILTKVITKHTKKLFKRQQVVLGALNGHIEETISGFSLVKAFCREEQVIDEFEDINADLCEVGIKAQIWVGFLMPLMNVINNLCFIFVAVLGGFMTIQGYITIGVVSSFLLYSKQFIRPINDIANMYNTLQVAIAGAERILELFEEDEEEQDRPGARDITTLKGDIEFKSMTFGYNAEKTVLKGINLKVKAGTNVAIVGSTGAGKTTIISLLARFYDVTKGEILLDGVDLRDYKREAVRRSFGIVLQDTALFDTTIMENIRYGKRTATDEEVIEAAKQANAHTFISGLSKGYQTIVGDSGSLLSQGEKQLITIARAFLADAPILILDEATSSVDTRTERRIKKAVANLTKGRTSFIIAHRLSTIRDCDVIVVIENGEIVEIGSHEELIAKNGRYKEMVTIQMGKEI